MDIYLFQLFAKRENSTKRPAMDLSNKFECTLKAPCSVTDPIIEIKEKIENYYYKYNYAYIPDFKRYYFIDNIRSEGMLWIYTMHCDVLASYKESIESHGFYILRSSSEYNGAIADTYYPPSFEHKTLIKQYPTMWTNATQSPDGQMYISGGVFVLGIVATPDADGRGSYGSIKYYAFEQSEFYELVHYLLTNVIVDGPDFSSQDATMSLQKALINPLSYIKSCIWLPIDYSTMTGTEKTSINVWDWTVTGCTGKLLTSNTPYRTVMQQIDKHNHPQALARGEYMNASPYTRISLLYPPFGLFELDTAALIDADYIMTECKIDLISGLGTFDIYASMKGTHRLSGSDTSNNMLNRIKTQIGVPIQLTEIGYDYSNYLATAVGIGAEALMSNFGNMMNSTISNAISQIGTAANAMRTKSSSMGSNGGFSELSGYAILYEDYYLALDEDLGHLGRPLCKIRTFKNLGNGFYIVRDGDIELRQALYPEIMQIKTYLESGIFYE